MSYLASEATKGITVSAATYVLRMFIVDDSIMEYVSGTMILDGVSYGVPETGLRLSDVEEGAHTIEVIPSGFEFVNWVPTGGATPDSTTANPTGFTLTANGDMIAHIQPVAIETALTISAPDTVERNEAFTVSGVLTRVDTGAGLSGETVNLTYNGATLGSTTTATDGSYSFDVSIPDTGSYTLKAEFPGSGSMGASMASVGVTVGKVSLFDQLYARFKEFSEMFGLPVPPKPEVPPLPFEETSNPGNRPPRYQYSTLPDSCECYSCGYVLNNPGGHCRDISCPRCGEPMWRV